MEDPGCVVCGVSMVEKAQQDKGVGGEGNGGAEDCDCTSLVLRLV